jgi:hypothetical protein
MDDRHDDRSDGNDETTEVTVQGFDESGEPMGEPVTFDAEEGFPGMPDPLILIEYVFKGKDGAFIAEGDIPQIGDLELFRHTRGVVTKVVETRKDGRPFFQITVDGDA